MIIPIKPLKKVPKDDWPAGKFYDPNRMAVYQSKQFLVQVFKEPNDGKRVSVNRVKSDENGWKAEITWDELQQIKNKIAGYEAYAVEVYPRAQDVIRAANMRHLWVFDQPLAVGWFKK